MTRSHTQVSERPAEGMAQRAISFAEQNGIMARARRQRAEELARLTRAAATKVSRGIEAIFRWLANHRQAARNMG